MNESAPSRPSERRGVVRNVAFLLLCVAAAGALLGALWKQEPLPAPAGFSPDAFKDAGFTRTVQQLDAAFDKAWTGAGVEPTPPAPVLTLARRLSLGLAGTVPSLEEIRALEKQPADQAVQWWLTYLFQDRRYSDYLAERVARAAVGVEGGPFLIYRRHRMTDWISNQIADNRPYDALVRELIASTGTWTSEPEVNFVTATVPPNDDKKTGPDEIKMAGRVSRAFLGVRLDCVECHDDFMGGDWTQRDFHQLAAFFAQAEMSLTGVRDNQKINYQFRYHRQPEEEVVPPVVPFNEQLLKSEGTRREQLAAWVTHPDNRPFARTTVNRVWALLFNRPLVEPIDNIPLAEPFPPGLELLVDDLIAHQFDLQRLIRVIAASRVFQRDSRFADPDEHVTDAHEKLFAAFPLTRLRPDQVAGGVIQSSSLRTIDAEAHVLFRVTRFFQQAGFVKRYGDAGEDEFNQASGTIPQRLILMNGELVTERTKENIVMNASTRIGSLAPTDEAAIETAYLCVLTRRPTDAETAHFVQQLEGRKGSDRSRAMEDLHWTLINATEFSWNH
jgi:hypothetical protein